MPPEAWHRILMENHGGLSVDADSIIQVIQA